MWTDVLCKMGIGLRQCGKVLPFDLWNRKQKPNVRSICGMENGCKTTCFSSFTRQAFDRSFCFWQCADFRKCGDIPKLNPRTNVTFCVLFGRPTLDECFSNSTKNTNEAWCEPLINLYSQIFQLETIDSEVYVHSVKNSLYVLSESQFSAIDGIQCCNANVFG